MTERYLLIQTGFLGDAVLASGMINALAAARPGSDIGIVVRHEFAGLFAGHPALAEVHPFDKKERKGAAKLVSRLVDAEYTTAFLPHRSFRSAMIARRAEIGRRIGFRQSGGRGLLTDRVEYLISRHETARNGMLLERGGIETSPGRLTSWLVPDAAIVEEMARRFGGDRRPIVVAPGSVWRTKRWGEGRFAELVGRLRAAGERVLLVGSGSEREICDEVALGAMLPAGENLAGELSLPELLALVSIAGRVISNDSAPLHLAGSVGTPATAIFGPTVPEFGFGPLGAASAVVQTGGLACRPCRIHGSDSCPIGTHECMSRISAEDVIAASAAASAGASAGTGGAAGR